MGMKPSIQTLMQLMRDRKEQETFPYVLLLGSSLSLTPAVRSSLSGAEDWETFWKEMDRRSPTERRAWLKRPLDELGLEPGYQAMARLAEAGYFNLILTLNVDDTIDNALKTRLSASEYHIWVRGQVSNHEIVAALDLPTPRLKVFKLRGDINIGALSLTDTEQFEFPGDLGQSVSELLERDTILVGEIFSHDTDVQRCIKKSNSALWCILPDEPSHDSFIGRTKRSRSYVEIITGPDAEFNMFFTALAESLLPTIPGGRRSQEAIEGRRDIWAKFVKKAGAVALWDRESQKVIFPLKKKLSMAFKLANKESKPEEWEPLREALSDFCQYSFSTPVSKALVEELRQLVAELVSNIIADLFFDKHLASVKQYLKDFVKQLQHL
jgi:hypothetical protein